MAFGLERVISSQVYDPNSFLAETATQTEDTQLIEPTLATGIKTYETAISKFVSSLK